MNEPGDWLRLLAEAASDVGTQPKRICDLCVSVLGMTGAGISLVTESGNRGVVCSTDDVAARIEELQFSLGEGPCVDAVLSGAPVLVPDLREPAGIALDRWPAFLDSANGADIRAVFAFPLQIGSIRIGALDLYRDTSGELTDGELSAALLAADAASLALLHLDTTADQMFAEGMDTGAGYQLEVHQATGMVKVQAGVSLQHALLLLRARAFASGRPLRDVANDVIARRASFSMED